VVFLALICFVRNPFFCSLAAQGVILKLLKQNDYLNLFYRCECFFNWIVCAFL